LFLMIQRPPLSTLVPFSTLFRSHTSHAHTLAHTHTHTHMHAHTHMYTHAHTHTHTQHTCTHTYPYTYTLLSCRSCDPQSWGEAGGLRGGPQWQVYHRLLSTQLLVSPCPHWGVVEKICTPFSWDA